MDELTANKRRGPSLTCWGLKNANLAFLNTIVQSIHKLQLDVIGLVGMMKISRRGVHDLLSDGAVP